MTLGSTSSASARGLAAPPSAHCIDPPAAQRTASHVGTRGRRKVADVAGAGRAGHTSHECCRSIGASSSCLSACMTAGSRPVHSTARRHGYGRVSTRENRRRKLVKGRHPCHGRRSGASDGDGNAGGGSGEGRTTPWPLKPSERWTGLAARRAQHRQCQLPPRRMRFDGRGSEDAPGCMPCRWQPTICGCGG